jgi:putative transcription factor
MQCEICGSELRGRSFKITIDGSELDVCGKCSQYGTIAKKHTPVSRKVAPVARTPARTSRSKKTGFEGLNEEFVDEYDQLIRDARQSRGWTQDELATKMKEKVSLIKKIERGEIIPEDSVRIKLERTLDIKLTERIGESDWSGERLNKGTTLGDIVKIKRK